MNKHLLILIVLVLVAILLGMGIIILNQEQKPNNENKNMNQEKLNTNDSKKDQEVTPSTDTINTQTQATIKTNLGDIKIELFSTDSPETVNNFIKLAKQGFYDGIKFHRVIKDFMIQAGDPLTKDDNMKDRWGSGGPGYTFDDEFNNHKLVAGSLAMANAGPNTNGSQFFIVTADAVPWLDGKHTNFGKVIAGMDIVTLIENSETEGPDRPINDVIINSIELK